MRILFDTILDLTYRFFGIEAINRILLFSGRRYNRRILKKFGAQISGSCVIHSPLIIHNAVTDYSNLSIGNQVHIGRDVLLDLRGRVSLGDRTVISMRCSVITHIDTGASELVQSETEPVTLGEGAYLGAGVTVLHGVSIGKNVIVGAHSLVRSSIPDGQKWAGTPAKQIG